MTMKSSGPSDPGDNRSDARNTIIPANPGEVFAAMSDPARVARWWRPAGFTSTIHQFEFTPGGSWLLTLHGPDGRNCPNESRFARVVADELVEIEHLGDHHFLLTIELHSQEGHTEVRRRQTFDTVEHYERIAEVIASANQRNLERLAAEVRRGRSAD